MCTYEHQNESLRKMWWTLWSCLPSSLGPALLPENLQGKLSRACSARPCPRQEMAWLPSSLDGTMARVTRLPRPRVNWQLYADRLGSLEIDDQFELGWLLDRQVAADFRQRPLSRTRDAQLMSSQPGKLSVLPGRVGTEESPRLSMRSCFCCGVSVQQPKGHLLFPDDAAPAFGVMRSVRRNDFTPSCRGALPQVWEQSRAGG
jgi:hypothetical protein